ncbi:MAG: HupE/UreJ family protein [Mesorhizobium sp.]|uniref:HupE/UreJ family protein n=1 Tax=unclassified Mesorhizobium TaxID=325217 RepID=UPI000FE57095|nr:MULTISPECIES: HupE/UreJ family protein [unclassified Mesorhizobium]RWB28071.1 MAG: HupE/UreJ family protein [Mesorhizobium sp.]RWC10117.1 MAG: HupE/UreJ family protein [Mesorhizobium sp.]RWE70711.1 MAG: HupE/UreJ family protein [Mesorhizobium sp.]RWF58503.1 MAG: HupE/UreJ family protein [Mesorhizobium sp.]TGT94085.1 HupE/UreJ family protein [Mesorhizobium sp. M5C.F.Ca.ET.164.01.1.1]
MKTLARLGILSALAALTPSLAFAHSGGAHVHGFFAGLEHPLLDMDHLLAMVAVGMIGARAAGRSFVLVPLFFVSAMVAGALLGMAGIGLPSLETGIALSLVVFGAIVGLARPLPLAAAAALTALFGLFHGNAHGLEIPESAGGIAYAAGFMLGTSMLHAIGALSVFKFARWPMMVRTAGLATSLVGLAMAAQTF